MCRGCAFTTQPLDATNAASKLVINQIRMGLLHPMAYANGSRRCKSAAGEDMRPGLSRRLVLGGMLASSWWPARAVAAQRPRFVADPFSVGVASGYPTPDGFSLWTRLAPIPLLPDGGMEGGGVPVTVEVAEDEGFRTIVHTADLTAFAELGHSVHTDVTGLAPDHW